MGGEGKKEKVSENQISFSNTLFLFSTAVSIILLSVTDNLKDKGLLFHQESTGKMLTVLQTNIHNKKFLPQFL